MKKAIVLAASLVVVGAFCLSSCGQLKSVKLTTSVDSAAYMLGFFQGANMKQGLSSMPGDSLDVSKIVAGLEAALLNKDAKMTPEQASAFLTEYFQKVSAAAAEKGKVEGEKFLEENKTAEGVKVTESGLQYKVLQEGDGVAPADGDIVKVHYTGKLIDGTVFDSSVERGEPVEFGVDQVIAGWTEGLKLMKKGAKYMFYIPSALAYGERGAGDKIRPNSTLIFEVELLDVKPNPNKAPAAK